MIAHLIQTKQLILNLLAPKSLSFIAKSSLPQLSIEHFVRNIVIQLTGIKDESYSETAHLQYDCGLSYSGLVELVLECERRFSIAIRDAELSHVRTIHELISLIKGKVQSVHQIA